MATTKKTSPVIGQKDVPPAIPKAAKPVAVVAKPVAPKVAAKKVVAKAVPIAAAKAPAKKKAAPAAKSIAPEQRANYIEVAAFYIAERRGFAPGSPEQDYLDAAAEIDRLIAGGHFAK